MTDNGKFAFIMVRPNKEIVLVEKDNYILTLDELYEYLECNSIEVIPTIIGSDYLLIIDEEGRLKPNEPNWIATAFANVFSEDPIVGNAIFAISVTDETDERDLYAINFEEAEDLMDIIVGYKSTCEKGELCNEQY